jgi:MgtC family
MIQMNVLLPLAGRSSNSFVMDDRTRLPLGILTGVGFIGGSAILHRGDITVGVTTAATLWPVPVIGLCIGGGQSNLAWRELQSDSLRCEACIGSSRYCCANNARLSPSRLTATGPAMKSSIGKWRTTAFPSSAPEYRSAPENIASSFSISEKRGHHLELRCRYLF